MNTLELKETLQIIKREKGMVKLNKHLTYSEKQTKLKQLDNLKLQLTIKN